MKEKVKCKVCHLKIDKDLDICPFCGAKQSEVIEEKKEIIVNDKKETKDKPLEFIAVLVTTIRALAKDVTENNIATINLIEGYNKVSLECIGKIKDTNDNSMRSANIDKIDIIF